MNLFRTLTARVANRPRILIVEDEDTITDYIASQLAMAGYEVAGIAESSEEVL